LIKDVVFKTNLIKLKWLIRIREQTNNYQFHIFG
jgi:hypothetical protein